MMTEQEKGRYIRRAFEDYARNKAKARSVSIPGTNSVDYTRPAVVSGGQNGVEKSVVQYIDKTIGMEKKLDIVRLTMRHYEIEDRRHTGKGKHDYIYYRWVRRRSTYVCALKCGISERTARYWAAEIMLTAEFIAEQNNLFP